MSRTSPLALILTLAAGCATVEKLESEKLERQFALAKQECAEAGGQWITWFHSDGFDDYSNSMTCLVKRPPARDPGWCDPLLPYRITIEYNRRTKEIVEFTRTTGAILGCPRSPVNRATGADLSG